jgi:hypothetical protein
MVSKFDATDPERPSVLIDLLQHTVALVEYYGHLETDESNLCELKLALIRTIDRLECEQAARAVAAKGREPDRALVLRSEPSQKRA